MLTVGEILKQEREKRGLTLKDIEKKTKVREKFLVEVEASNWRVFPSRVYIAGIVKNYARLLELDVEKILAFFRREYDRLEEGAFKKHLATGSLTPETRKFIRLTIIFLFIIFFLYFGYQLKEYFSPPKVDVLLPRQQTFKRVNKIHIVGKTEKEASIVIFGEQVFPNKDGVFTYDFPLKLGKNTLVVEVVGANGRKSILKKEFFLSP